MPSTPLRSALVDQLTTKLIDFHRRRITNAADAVDPQDYVTKKQLDEAIAGIEVAVEEEEAVGSSVVVSESFDDITLVAGVNNITTTAGTPGDRLTIAITQTAAGNGTITWDANFHSSTSKQVSATASKSAIFDFICRSDGLWWQTGYQFLES